MADNPETPTSNVPSPTTNMSFMSLSLEDGNEDPKGEITSKKRLFAASTMSKASRRFDIGDKGYLTDAERAARELDDKNEGKLTNEKVVMIVEQTIRLREAHGTMMESMSAMKKTMCLLSVLVVLLALSNLGTSFVAVQLSKDTSIGSDGLLLSKKDGTAIHTVGTGEVFTLNVEGRDPFDKNPYACVAFEEAGSTYKTVKEGTATSVVWKAGTGHASKETGMALTFQGSTINETHACLWTVDGKSLFCYLFHSHLCSEQEGRRLQEVHPDTTKHRRELFQMIADGATPEDIDIHRQSHRRLCPPCVDQPCVCGGRRRQEACELDLGSVEGRQQCFQKVDPSFDEVEAEEICEESPEDCQAYVQGNCLSTCKIEATYSSPWHTTGCGEGALDFSDACIPTSCGEECATIRLQQWCHDNVCTVPYDPEFVETVKWGVVPGSDEFTDLWKDQGYGFHVCDGFDTDEKTLEIKEGFQLWTSFPADTDTQNIFSAALGNGGNVQDFCHEYCCCWHNECDDIVQGFFALLPCKCVLGGCDDPPEGAQAYGVGR